MLAYDFMDDAFLASGIVAVLAGLVGWFLVLRSEAFASHALSHVGFSGATGALLIGLPPSAGMIGVTVAGGVAMGLMGPRLAQRDVAIGLVLSLALGCGLLFLHFFTASAAQATALLFGNVLAVGRSTIAWLAVVAALGLACLALAGRRLLFASLQPDLAEASGVSPRTLAVMFLALVAVATAACAQIVGVLLVFTLMVGPAAAAHRLTSRVGLGLLLAPALAVTQAWLGLVCAYYTDWPTSFWIAAFSGATYAAAVLIESRAA